MEKMKEKIQKGIGNSERGLNWILEPRRR